MGSRRCRAGDVEQESKRHYRREGETEKPKSILKYGEQEMESKRHKRREGEGREAEIHFEIWGAGDVEQEM